MWLQIQSFIQSLGLGAKASVKDKKVPPSKLEDKEDLPQEHTKLNTTSTKEDEPVEKPGKKKKKNKDSSKSENDLSAGQHQVDESISRQLLQLSAKSYKRLLVSMDEERVWYEQVRPTG